MLEYMNLFITMSIETCRKVNIVFILTPVYMYVIGKTLFSLYLSYLYQIKCPRIYFKCCIHEIEII